MRSILTSHAKLRWQTLLRFPIYPPLVGIYPVVFLLEQNLGQAALDDASRSLTLAALVSVALMILIWIPTRDIHLSAGLAAFAVLFFFTYGHTYRFLETVSILGAQLGRHRYLIPFFFVSFVFMVRFLWTHRDLLRSSSPAINLISLLIVILPATQIAKAEIRSSNASRPAAQPRDSVTLLGGNFEGDQLPDIYYIVPDSYARADVLREQFGYDNSEFYKFLESRGFYVASDSRANYLWTHLSLTASLNMDYVQRLLPDYTKGPSENLRLPIQENSVRQALEELGYSTVVLASGWDATEWTNADYLLVPDMSEFEWMRQRQAVNAFESILIETTAGLILLDLDAVTSTTVGQFLRERLREPFVVQREIALAQFDNLERVHELPGPKFVFVHLLPPHGPHLFGPNGEPVEQEGAFTLQENPKTQGSGSAENEYLGELEYVSQRLMAAIVEIQDHSERPVIIILQSDHGPAYRVDWENPTAVSLRAKSAILNAYYLPEDCREDLYPSITPVNSFRLVFECVFGTSLGLLEDITYFGYYDLIPIEQIHTIDGN